MVTIKDIAEIAGVSTATVSRAINGTGYVSERTKKRIEDIIREYNYSPSASAVNLSKRETNTIGVIVPEIANTFFGELLQGISEAVDRTEFLPFYFDSDNNSKKEERAILALEQQRIRGLIITPARDSDAAVNRRLNKQLERLNVPTVVVDREFQGSRWDGVFFENYQSGYCAGEALIKAGHKKLGIITGDLNLKIARERYDGFMQAAFDYDCPVEEKYVYQGDFTIAGAYEKTKQMLEAEDRPEAVLTCNNLTSLGFLKAVTEGGLRIGEDIAVIGIDRIAELDVLDYGFSYVGRDTVEMGRLAVKMLLERMESPKRQRQICMIPYELVLNGSEKKEG
ncbi:MAG: LacI family DNA-binding transcriptional regulator [Lachnospiraceae bacterium]|nr:LacI family DNA-binding transcriptional regulator [Lachnospiraceae bacterium]